MKPHTLRPFLSYYCIIFGFRTSKEKNFLIRLSVCLTVRYQDHLPQEYVVHYQVKLEFYMFTSSRLRTAFSSSFSP